MKFSNKIVKIFSDFVKIVWIPGWEPFK